MAQIENELMLRLAAKYIWWKTPEEAMLYPERVVAQVMDIGQFNVRSWAYWHYRLDLAKPGEVPPLPRRRVE